MTDPDKLPALPEPDSSVDYGIWCVPHFTVAQMRSYALTAIKAERAQADALQAERDESNAAIELLNDRISNMKAEWHRISERADALEAALRAVVTNGLSGESERAAWALLENE